MAEPVPLPGVPFPSPSGVPPAEVVLRPAKISDRFIAYSMDFIPFVAGYYISLIVLLTRFQDLATKANFFLVFAVAWTALCWLYQVVGNLCGGTIGKKLMGIAVVDREGRRLGFVRSVVRAFGCLLSTPLFNLGCIVGLFHPESRAFHDILAGSLVVEASPRSKAESWIIFLGSMCLIFAMVFGTAAFRLTQPTPEDLKRIAKARDGLKILAQIEEQFKASHGTYTASISEIAQTSGDVEQFKSAMSELFDPNLFQIQAGNRRYRISAAARDRKKTRVTIEGP
ncbi:MAG: RDD family protein [Elusimicrobia bacterium]|nr:RDD family protein [Elusimicrobiota bacterium]